MVRKYEREATTSEVEDEPRAWWDQLEKKAFDLRDLATCLPVPTGEVGDSDWRKHERWDDDSDNSVCKPDRKQGKKSKGKTNEEEEDDDDDQGNDEYEEEADQEPKPEPKGKAKAKAPVKNKAPAKREARARVYVPANNGDSSSDDQNVDDPVDHNANENEEGGEQGPANVIEISSSVPTEESEGEVEQKPKDKGTSRGNATSQPKTRAKVKATTKKRYSYGYECIDDIDEPFLNGYNQDNNGSDDEYIPPTRSRKKDAAKGNGMAKGRATKSNGMAKGRATKIVDCSGYDQSTGEFEEEVEPRGTRKSNRIATAAPAAKQNTTTKAAKNIAGAMKTSTRQGEPLTSNDIRRVKKVILTNVPRGTTLINLEDEMDCTEDNQSADRVDRVFESDESKSLFVRQDSNDADKVNNSPAGLIDPRDIKQEKVSPDPENPAAATQGAYMHDFDVGVNHELLATTGSKRQASNSPLSTSRDQHPTKRRAKKSNDPFGLMEIDSDSDPLPHHWKH